MYEKLVLTRELKKERWSRKKQVKQFEALLEERYGKYKEFEYISDVMGGYDEHKIPRDKENLHDFVELLKTAHRYYEFLITVEFVYEEEDFQQAAAFLLDFPCGCDEYDNYHDRDEFETMFNPCDACLGVEVKELTYLSFFPGEANKMKKEYTGMASLYEDCHALISIPMRKYLIENGIDRNSFRPVYNIKEEICAYRLYGESNMLPLASVKTPHGWVRETCPVCGRIYMSETLFDEDADLDEVMEFIDKPYQPHRISQEGMEKLKDVNLTTEYYYTNRRVVISKKMFDLMRTKWEDIQNYVIPIIPEDKIKSKR